MQICWGVPTTSLNASSTVNDSVNDLIALCMQAESKIANPRSGQQVALPSHTQRHRDQARTMMHISVPSN